MPKVDLPDFDDLMKLADKIGELVTRREKIKWQLDVIRANVSEIVTLNEDFWIGGKPPSVSYTRDNYFKVGTSEPEMTLLSNLEHELAQVNGDLETARARFDVLKTMIDVWRTESANERSAIL